MNYSSPRTYFVLPVLCALLLLPAGRAAGALGDVKATYDLPASRFAVDPIRPRVYASITGDGAIAVIDTNTLAVIDLIPVGSQPIGLSISADGNTLYVANNGSLTAGVGVIDLNTLTVEPSLAVPEPPSEIEAGVNNQLYLAPAGSEAPGSLVQMSTTGTGVSLFTGGLSIYSNGSLQISPDRTTLYVGLSSDPNSTLASFDVSGTAPQLGQVNSNLGADGGDVEISHSGSLLTYASDGDYAVYEFAATDLSGALGIFVTGAYPHNFAFSPDDSIGYASNEDPEMLIYDTATCELTGSFAIPYGEDVDRIQVDDSGGSIFAASVTTDLDTPAGSLYVYDTGEAAASITSTNAVAVQAGAPFSYQITATNSPSSFGASDLPPGLSVDPVAGLITGTCPTAGYYQAFVSASNSAGTGIGNLNITVGTAPTVPLDVIISGSGTVAMVSGTTTTNLSGSSDQVAGSFVSLSASAATNSFFIGWTGSVNTMVNPLNIPLNAATTVQAVFAPAPFGTIEGIIQAPAVRFAADPVRPRMYATLTTGSLAVIDTNTLQVITTLAIGASPVGLAVTPDGSRLYIADSSSTSAGVDVVDLSTLTVLPSLATPLAPSDIAVGSDNTLYLTPAVSASPGNLMQISTTGTSQLLFNDANDDIAIGGGGFLQMSPDQKTLYFGNSGMNPSTLASFDVSSGTPVLLQQNNSTVGGGGEDLELSHSGSSIFYVNTGGQGGYDGAYWIYSIPVTNLSTYQASIDQAAPVVSTPTNITLSPDDAVAYSVPEGQYEGVAYDGKTGGELGSFVNVGYASRLKTDNAGQYLYMATEDNLGNPTGISIYFIGRPGPAITSGTVTSVVAGYPFSYQTKATNNPTSFFATGLPSGLTISASTGLITGNTLESGTWQAFVSAGNAYGTGSLGLTIVVAAGTAPAVASGAVSELDYGRPFTYQIVASGAGPLTYGASGLPAGLAVDPSTGLISGTLDDAGDFPVILSATNNYNGVYGTGLLSLQIYARLTTSAGTGGFIDRNPVSYIVADSTVSLSAVPIAGYLFQDWTGTYTSTANPLVFPMPAAADLTASFVPATFYAGSYTGLFSNSLPSGSGLLSIKLGSSGAFTGYVEIGGVRHAIASTFAPGNTATISIPRKGAPTLTLELALDISGAAPAVTGTASDGAWTSPLSTSLTPVYPKGTECPQAGPYTLALSSSSGPTGSGYATLSVSKAGIGTIVGALADGTPFSASGPVEPNASMPVYCPLYGAKGGIAGTLTFQSATSTGELSGTMNWSKPAGLASSAYPPAISTTLEIAGSSYDRLAGLSGTGGGLTFSGGEIDGMADYPFSLTPPLKIVILAPGSHSVSFALAPLRGVFSGTVIDGTRHAVYHGVLLQEQNSGAGYFTDPAGGGAVSLQLEP